MMAERRDNIGNWSWRSLYQVMNYLFLMADVSASELKKNLNSDLILSLRILPPLEAVLGSLTVYSSRYREQFL